MIVSQRKAKKHERTVELTSPLLLAQSDLVGAVIVQFKQLSDMIQGEKKKRSHSGSRSKSRKYKGTELSVDLRARPTLPDQPKLKTENSSSLNKSKPSRKTSLKPQKKHTKSSNKDGKDAPSHSVSADRKLSHGKANKTEANYEHDDIEKFTLPPLLKLRALPVPACPNVNLLKIYYDQLRSCFEGTEDCLYAFCMEIHAKYTAPLSPLLEMLLPYQECLQRKEEIVRQIDQQVFENERLWGELSPIDVEIFRMKEKIEENRQLIEKKKQFKALKHEEEEQSFPVSSQGIQARPAERVEGLMAGKGFRLDLEGINKEGQVGFHEEFYSKLEEFSESWRDQALREKRF